MSDSGEDKGPNRTVFRPSPLQSLKGAAPPGGPPSATAFPGAPGAAAAPPPSTPAPRALPTDEDIPQAPAAARPRNPMMTAAAPALALIAGMRSGRVQIRLPDLHQKASASVTAFSQALAAAGYDAETTRRAQYALCATIDDIAQNLPDQAADGAEWARRSLVVQAFNENIGGDRFWQLLEDMLSRPADHAELIELYHACLAAGFEGRYRVTPDGRSRLQDLLTRAYAALQHPRSLSQTELAPHWRGTPTPPPKVSFWAILALAGGIALAVLLTGLIGLRGVLVQTGRPSIHAIRAINPDQALRMSRVAPTPPVPTSTQLQRLQGFLAPEIAQHLVAVEQDARSIRVRTTVGELFASGSDALAPGREALFVRIAQGVETEKGPVKVEGHADADRVSSLTFPDNFALSTARAATVAGILKGHLSDPGRVSAEGFGDSQPIAPNSTSAGKALNRRVEIVIPRGD